MQLTGHARSLRKQQTNAEQKLWYFLRNRQLMGYKFRRQYPIGHYIIDFFCFDKRLIIELDGGQHLLQENYDITRTHFLEHAGYRVIRFWDDTVLKDTQNVLEVIFDALGNPHLNPLPEGEERNKNRC